MKTTTRTTLPDSTHERPIHEVKWSKWYLYLSSFGFVILSWPIVYFVFSYPTLEEDLVIRMAIYLPVYIMFVAGMALQFRDIYFYERHVEMRRFLTFMKRRVIYYDDMHVHIMTYGEFARQGGTVNLSHYETWPCFWESPYAWFKANTYDLICFPRPISFPRPYCTPEILEFLKTKAQSVSYYTIGKD